MPFNSDTYHANKARRHSRDLLAEARQVKASGSDPAKVCQLVKRARLYARIARIFAS